MFGPRVNAQIAHLHPPQGPARNHPLHRLQNHAFGMGAAENAARRMRFDAARITRMPVIDLVGELFARQADLRRIDDDDVVAAIDMGRETRLMLAPQPQRDDRSEPAEDQPIGIDQHPFFLDL